MRTTLDNLRADMVLATDINDANGRLLLPNGTTLTEKHIRYFRMWGITEVEIVGDQPETEAEATIDPTTLAEIERALAPRFSHVDRGHPAMAALFRHCVLSAIKNRP
jgi:hypothetical protein